MKISRKNAIYLTVLIYFIVLNIVVYIPFSIYNLSLNVVNWDIGSRTFYCYLSGGINISIVFLIPAIYNDFKDRY